MARPNHPNTSAAAAARRDPLGRVSKPVRILCDAELHERIAKLKPDELGAILEEYFLKYAAAHNQRVDATIPFDEIVWPEEIIIKDLASVAKADAKLVPSLPAVYIIFDGETIEYVGQTVDLRRRIGDHLKSVFINFKTVYWFELYSSEGRIALEYTLMKVLRPRVGAKTSSTFNMLPIKVKLDKNSDEFMALLPPLEKDGFFRGQGHGVSRISKNPDALKRLGELFKQGYKVSELADYFGVSYPTLYAYLKKLDNA